MGEYRKKCAEILVTSDSFVSVWSRENWVVLPDGSSVPAYLSCRRLLSQPTARKAVKAMLAQTASTHFGEATSVIGLATAGIVWGDAVAENMELPFGYVRSQKKGYGLGSLIEGNPPIDTACILVDDTLHTGDSMLVAANVLQRERNITVMGGLTIASLYSGGTETFSERASFETLAITDYEAILAASVNHDVLSSDQADQMAAYYADPSGHEFKRN